MTNLFQETTVVSDANVASGSTARLTAIASKVARDIMSAVEANEEHFAPMVIAAQKSHAAMDALILDAYNFDGIETEIDFLNDETDEILANMTKSQQSKRSRLKSMTMTLSTFTSMMTGAIAEILLRKTTGATKQNVGGGTRTGSKSYSEELLQELAADTERLGREIRNVQSKKSIMKSRADFDENSENWLHLLEAEIALKALRPITAKGARPTTTTTIPDPRLGSVLTMMSDIDVDTLKAASAKEILAAIKAALGC